jgi:hypothetical protein
VKFQNASRATTAVDGDDPRECEQLGRRLIVLATPKPRGRQAGLPNTAMASAFLDALVCLVSANHSKTKVTLPTGIVDVGELELVLRTLGLIDQRAP